MIRTHSLSTIRPLAVFLILAVPTQATAGPEEAAPPPIEATADPSVPTVQNSAPAPAPAPAPASFDTSDPAVSSAPRATAEPAPEEKTNSVPPPTPPEPQAHTTVIYGPTTPQNIEPAPRPPKINRNRGLVPTIVGFSAFGMSYLMGATVGATIIDSETIDDNGDDNVAFSNPSSRAYGRSLLVPLIGPFLAIPHATTAMGRLATVVLGLTQVGTLTLGVLGATRLAKSRSAAKMQLGIAPTPGFRGATAHLQMRF